MQKLDFHNIFLLKLISYYCDDSTKNKIAQIFKGTIVIYQYSGLFFPYLKAIYTLNKLKLHGKYTEYHPNLSIHILAEYKNGKLDGHYYEYKPNGNLLTHSRYKNGELHGRQISYFYQTNLIKTLITYNSGCLSGYFCEWNIDKQLICKKYY